MYKGASQGLQKRHGVDKPHPSRGFIDGGADPSDVLPRPENMPVAALRAEQTQLRVELARIEQELLVAKSLRRKGDIYAIGQRKEVHQTRLSAVNKAMNAKDGPTEARLLGVAIREVAGDELANRIFARAKQLRTEMTAQAIEARRAVNAEGGAVEDESAVANGDAPKKGQP